MTTLRVQKLGNGPQEEPRTERRLGGGLEHNWEKMGNLNFQRMESCLSFSVLSSTWRRWAS